MACITPDCETSMDETTTYQQSTVLVNDERQYSRWPLDKAVLAGWRNEGIAGDRQACLDHVEKV